MTDPMPAAVAQDVARLGAELDGTVPKRTAKNLLLATWNISAFGDVTEKWNAGPADAPKRDLHGLACITEVISRFDVAAIQEVKRDLTVLRRRVGERTATA